MFFIGLFFYSFLSVLFLEKETIEMFLFFSLFVPVVVPLFTVLINNGTFDLNKVCFYILIEPLMCFASWFVAMKDKVVKKEQRIYLRFPFGCDK